MHTHGQILFDRLTASRTEFACVAWVNLYALSTSIRSFIESELHKLIPSCIGNAFSQRVILDHAPDIQILKGDDSEQGYERVRELVREVATTISDALMDAPRRFASLFALGFCQSLLVRAKKSWVGNLFTRRECGKVRESNIYSDASLALRQGFSRTCHREAGVPFTRRSACDGQRFNLATGGAVQLNLNVSDFRQAQLAIFERKAGLGIGEGIVSPSRAEAREACFLFTFLNSAKEVLKSLVESVEYVLQYLAVNLVEFGTRFF